MEKKRKCFSNSNYFQKKTLKNWKAILNEFDSVFSNFKETDKKRWIFRGDKEETLEPHLEKAFRNFSFKKNINRQDFEKWLIRKFQRHAHHYLTSSEIPESEDFGQWLSIMSHYGAPTRLLDWTYSFFNAVFFAVNRIELDEKDKPKPCYVWAIDDRWLDEKAKGLIKSEDEELCKDIEKPESDLKTKETFKKAFFREKNKNEPDPITFVHGYNPLKLNKRLIAQKGFFLCQGNVLEPFEYNLMETIQRDKATAKKFIFRFKIHCSIKERKEILYKLYRLGVSSEVLFPDLKGFAESQLHFFAYPEVLKPGI